MARYLEKNEDDLRWNQIRRRITRELDTQISEWREVQLNQLLSGAWEKYTEALETGTKLALESQYSEWISKALDEAISEVVAPEEGAGSAPVAA